MIETGTFVTGVGILVSLDLAVLGISVVNARRVGTDETAREKAREAANSAETALRIGREAKREAVDE